MFNAKGWNYNKFDMKTEAARKSRIWRCDQDEQNT